MILTAQKHCGGAQAQKFQELHEESDVPKIAKECDIPRPWAWISTQLASCGTTQRSFSQDTQLHTWGGEREEKEEGWRMAILTFWNCLKGTNWTMSLIAVSPLGDLSAPPSPSRNSIALKSAPPTPTMMMDMGSLAAFTMACLVWSRSVITPSVMIRSTKYCDAVCCWVAAAANLATWFIIGEKLVGP